MRKNPVLWRWMLAVFVLTAVALAPTQAQRVAKKPLTYDVYDSWRSIQGTQISRDGTWLAYALAAQEGDGELVVRNLKTDKDYRRDRGQAPVISADGKYVVFTIAPPKADVDKAKKEKKKPEEQPKNGLGILNLATGEVATVDRVKSFKLAEESGTFVAYLMEAPPAKEPEKKEDVKKEPEKKEPAAKPAEKKEEAAKKPKEKKKEPGTELVLRELASGRTTSIAEVTEYVWNKPGTWLAYAVSSKKPEDDGLFAVSTKTADLPRTPLMKGLGHYKTPAFDEKGTQLAFLSDRDDYKAEASPTKLYYWTEGTPAAVELASGKTAGMPSGMAVSENGRLNFAKDGTKLFFGYAPAPVPEPDEDATPPVKVDIWNWKDADLQPMQKVNADQDKKRNYTAVVHFLPKERKLVPLAGPDLPTVNFSEDSKIALGSSSLPYRQLVSWDQGYSDYYLVNMADGSRKKILEKISSNVAISPGGQFLLYYSEQDRNWFTYRLLDGKTFNLTAKLGVGFFQDEWDTPSDPGPYGNAGWTEGDKSVLVYDKYDIWEVKPDGLSARNTTNGLGRKNGLVFRYVRLDPEERAIPVKEPVLLSALDDATKGTGFYRVSLAPVAPAPAAKKPAAAPAAEPAPAGPDPAKVIMMNKLMSGLRKAKNADVYLFTIQTSSEFPNLWTSGPTFWDMKKVSDANPQQAAYVWGQSELIRYMNADGKTLDAVLIKPEDFDASKKYPLMVYIYERLADGLNRFLTPGPGTSVNVARYVSNSYIILQPDIVYETGYPGSSALKCVVPAVQKVVGMGFIDPKRIGIQGHSWGGYEITYMITQTDIFAAVEAGASVANMTSAYGGIRWGSGMVREFQYEKTQSRIGATLFDRALQFIENSPLFWAERVKTPYLTIHNDEDDAVPWYQGIEFFTALRRLGKEAYMFNFNGEKHGLRERDNQKYWTVHLDEFFDHFLLGKPAPEWMIRGVSYLERGKRDVASLFKKKDEKK
jgi:dipeptidyl aminopeptidase/acylaminoacyl peptidase